MLPRVPLRKLSISKGQPRTVAEKQKVAQERYSVNMVRTNPRFKMIISHLAQGTSPGDIAAHFAQQGWITVNERTFVECIRAYRRIHAEEIRSVEKGGLAAIVDPNQPQSDVLNKLHYLLDVQMHRIGIDVANENNISKLFATTAKEMEVANKLIETIAKIEGRIGEGIGGKHRKAENDIPADVNENLNSLRKDEKGRDRLHSLTRQLVKAQQ